MKLAIHGATGRMGASIVGYARRTGHEIVGAVATSRTPKIGLDLGEIHGIASLGVIVQDDISSALLGADVVIDFSHVSAVARLAKVAAAHGVALVSGTTSLDANAERALQDAAKSIPVLWAPNFSLGIQVLAELVRHAVKRLGPSFDVEVVEVHHRGKLDAPSGTASRLVDEVRAVRGEVSALCGREGLVGARTAEQVGVLAMRGGDVIGDHSIHLLGQGERLELTHRATSRDLFVRGAMFAAEALIGKAPGRYTISDILPPI
jgi:4-hydroxy-tetrahydrodipicolinate reductase